MTTPTTLRYIDESDRAYGVAGMAIALYLWDGEPYLASVSLENPVGESVVFTPAFGFSGNPRMTASLAWRELRNRFELSTAMIMGNAMCRAYIGSSTAVPAEMSRQLRKIIADEGRESCSLDDDEIEIVYNKTYRYLDRVFSHAGVAGVAHRFVSALTQQRTLSSSEVIELLSALGRL